jgi:GNAT superfamily N-acetyltransferase
MFEITRLEEQYLEGVSSLYLRVIQKKHSDVSPSKELVSFMRLLYLENPEITPETCSIVALDRGEAVGFYGTFPFSASLKGHEVTAIIGGPLVVREDFRSQALGFQLLRYLLQMPAALHFGDSANEASKKLWLVMKARSPDFYGQYWIKVLRPIIFYSRKIGERLGIKFNGWPGWRKTRAIDLDVVWGSEYQELYCELRASHRFLRCPQRGSLGWVLRVAEQMRFGTEIVETRDGGGKLQGWCLLMYDRSGMANVLSYQCRPSFHTSLLRKIFSQAKRVGASAVYGFGWDVARNQAALSLGAWLRQRQSGFVVKSVDTEFLQGLCPTGSEIFCSLEGDAWLSPGRLFPVVSLS